MALEQVLASVGISPADFTPGELAAIASSVGADPSVAAVIAAVHKCAPTKSRSSAFTGGNYHWSRNSDGSFNIFDVPVFAKHVRKLGMKLVAGKDGTPKVEEHVINVDEPWLNRAITINRTRFEQGKYMGSLHVRHHPSKDGEVDRTESAGKFLLKYVRPMMYDGETVPVLYADFVQIPAAIFERIKAGLLPYRSIESLPPKFEEIDSIALLDTETPWFRLPMLTPGEEIQREVYAATCPPLGSPLRGVAISGVNSLSALCYFAGGSYEEKGDEKKPKEDSKGGDRGDDGKEGGDKEKMDGSKAGLSTQCAECGYTHPDDERHGDEDFDREAGETGDAGGDTMGKILDVLTSIAKGQEAILKALPGQMPPPPAGKDTPVSESGTKESTIQSSAASEGRLAGVEQALATMKQTESVKALVAKAMADLCEFNLGAAAGEKLLAKAVASKDPESVVANYVDAVKEHGTKMPTPFSAARGTVSGKAFVPPPAGEMSEAVREYQAKGPEVLEKALKAHEMFLLCKEQGSLGGLSEKEFIKHRVEPGYGAALKG